MVLHRREKHFLLRLSAYVGRILRPSPLGVCHPGQWQCRGPADVAGSPGAGECGSSCDDKQLIELNS